MSDNPTTNEVPHPPDRGNRVVVSPTLKSPAFWAKVALTFLGVFRATPYCPEPLKPYIDATFALAAVYGLHAVQMVALSAGNQAANRAPGDTGPKAVDQSISVGSR